MKVKQMNCCIGQFGDLLLFGSHRIALHRIAALVVKLLHQRSYFSWALSALRKILC